MVCCAITAAIIHREVIVAAVPMDSFSVKTYTVVLVSDNKYMVYYYIMLPLGCSINNGGCSQLCVTSDNSFYCKCRSGFILGSDGTSCFPELSNILIINDILYYYSNIGPSLFLSITQTVDNPMIPVGSVYQTSTSGIRQELTVPVLVDNRQTRTIYSMDTNAVERVLYYGEVDTSSNSSSLWMSSLDDGSVSLLTTNNDGSLILGLTYDWIHDTLYWIQTQ